MREYSSDVAFTPTVKALQQSKGSRASYARMEQNGSWETVITKDLEAFLADIDMFYLATSNSQGQPYIQYRGGPPGFLRVLDERTLAFADFSGNRQYITLGNLQDNPQAMIFLIDYYHRRRIKLWGKARVVENDDALQQQLIDPHYSAPVERVILFEVDAWDVNCPQHIHRRYSEKQVALKLRDYEQRIADLEKQLQEAQTSGNR